MPTGNRYPREIRERAVRMAVEHRDEYPTEWAARASIAGKLGMTPETLRKWLRRDQVDNFRFVVRAVWSEALGRCSS